MKLKQRTEFERSHALQKKVMEAMEKMKPEAEHGSHLDAAFLYLRQTLQRS
jgi:hypothetical protein